MSRDIIIKSHKGNYSVIFNSNSLHDLSANPIKDALHIIDKNVARLYQSELEKILDHRRCLLVEATESNKSLDKFTGYIESLMELGIKRNQPLVAIGGGIVQDITCFLASTIMRGLPWIFYPTTLLAQSDSCIGSKSSIRQVFHFYNLDFLSILFHHLLSLLMLFFHLIPNLFK